MATNQISGFIQHLRMVLRDGAGLTDGQLLADYLSRRDEAAIAALVRRHGPMVWGVCRRVLRNHHDAEDAFQTTFLVLVRKAASIASRELLANWLYGVAHQTALKARATAAKRKGRERQATEMPEPAATQQDPWRDLQPLLDEELSRLPDKYRSVIVLCDLEGKTRKEVAGQLGCPEGTVAGRLARARIMLAKRLTRRGVALSGGALAAVLSQQAASSAAPASVAASTIKAASLFAAGKAAATGAISVKVAALTEGVLKTMLMTKLKIAIVVLFVASTVALTCGVFAGQQQTGLRDAVKVKSQIKPAELPIGDQEKLQGTWRLIDSWYDGGHWIPNTQDMEDDNFIVFKKTSVTSLGRRSYRPPLRKKSEVVKAVGAFTLDANKNPKVIVFTWETNPWNDEKDIHQQGVYTLDGDSLKLNLNIPGENLKLPAEVWPDNSDIDNFFKNVRKRMILTFRHEPASEKGVEKKP